ncbi:type III-B CRISPR module-associated protein Cmr3 [Thiohalobacter sp.]|uniref:type III-B CRISPR module-associated protein Cmr3 n=1 Tax=Thiohalobacter sp. TaxID=2025948 RepID=UPI00261E412E|nr:type III-B CRISPR module-associated protein Cmr3 [Thiohalobacter sp.]
MNAHFIEPMDVLFLRGNRLFGDAGSYGESMVPPWPSVAAGAIRTAILARDGADPAAFARGKHEHAHPTLGTPDAPGSFRITDFQLAWRGETGEGPLERFYPLPADLVATREAQQEYITLRALSPWQPAAGIDCSMALERLPVMAQASRSKPVTGLWLTSRGMQSWLDGRLPDASADLVPSARLWVHDERIGIGLQADTRRADDGKLFSMQAVAFSRGVGFLAEAEGDGLDAGTALRFGGDGRGAVVDRAAAPAPEADVDRILASRHCRLILATPGIFPGGWRLPGMDAAGAFELCGVRGRVVAAAVNRAEVVSGWDLALREPKPARRAVPAGSVYWIEDLQATPDDLRKLAAHGLWPETGYDARRRAEGFNRFLVASY